MYEIATMWVYTNDGRKVGEYEMIVSEETPEEQYEVALIEWCVEEGLKPDEHNQCLGTLETLVVVE